MLAFLRVFGEIAVTASGEKTHCAALRRQMSEVLIFSGALYLSGASPKTHSARHFCSQTVVTQTIKSADIWHQATKLSQPDIVRWKLSFGSICFGKRQSPSRMSCKIQRRLASMFSSDNRSASPYSACSSEHVFFSSPSRTRMEPSFWCVQAEATSNVRKANNDLRLIDVKIAPLLFHDRTLFLFQRCFHDIN